MMTQIATASDRSSLLITLDAPPGAPVLVLFLLRFVSACAFRPPFAVHKPEEKNTVYWQLPVNVLESG